MIKFTRFLVFSFIFSILFSLTNANHDEEAEYNQCLEDCNLDLSGAMGIEDSECIMKCHEKYKKNKN